MSKSIALLMTFLSFAGPSSVVQDPEAEYAARAARISGKKAKEYLDLATWCEAHLLWARRDETLRKVLELDPANALARSRLDEVKCNDSWIPADEADAKEIADQEARNLVFYGSKWIPAAAGEKLRRADGKAVRWEVKLRIDTPLLTMYSSSSLAFTRKLAAILANECRVYQQIYGDVLKLAKAGTPFRIYLFGDRETFTDVLKKECSFEAGPKTVGWYSQSTKTLYVGMLAGQESDPLNATRVAVHEMLHAMDHLYADLRKSTGAPIWLLEGRADYFGAAVRGRQVLPGAAESMPSIYISALKDGLDTLPLPRLLSMSPEEFTAPDISSQAYGLAWAWVHFLFHGEGARHAGKFRAFLKGGKFSRADLEKAVGNLQVLEPAFRRHVESVVLPALEAADSERK